jgi:hypothetical protein
MMAPHFERARVLHTAIQTATYELDEPIDRLEVTELRIFVWAGKKVIAMKYRYADSYGPDGVGMPGAGEWVVEKESLIDMPISLIARVLLQFRKATRMFS